MRVNRVERREHERRSGQDRRKMPDRKNSKMETTDRRKEEKRKEIRREEDAEKRFDDQIEGRNSVLELLESGKDVNKIFVTRGEKHGSINKILGIAKERKFIEEDYFAGYYGIKMPQSIIKTEKVKSFNIEDFKKLLIYLYSPDFKYSHRDEYLIAIHCGLRIGEVLGLKKQDVDLENGLLHIKRTTTLDKQGHTILGDRTKTPSGERDIVLTELTQPVLEHAIKNMKPNENDLLFCNKKGNVFTDSTLNDCLKRICKFIGIEDNAHNHKLRHSYSTNSYSVGIDYKVMEETLGHSDIRQTMDTYTDLPIETQRKELQKYVDSVKMLLGDSINEYTKEEKSLNP